MDSRETDIDIVFRNGFKDYEVLPPPEVWDNIHPVIRKKQRPFILLRSAAMIAVLLSIGFLVYRWSRENPSSDGNQLLSLNREPIPFTKDILPAITVPLKGNSNNIVTSPGEKLKAKKTNITIRSGEEASITIIPLFSPEAEIVTPRADLTLAEPQKGRKISSNSDIFGLNNLNKKILPDRTPVRIINRWSVAAMASPTYFSQFRSSSNEIAKQLAASEQQIMSYSGGVSLSYKINKRVSIQSGVYYSSVGQEVNGISSFSGFEKYNNAKGDRNFEVLTTSGNIKTTNKDIFLLDRGGTRVLTTGNVIDPEKANLQYINNSLKQSFSYLELPIVLRYKMIDRSLDLNLIGCVSYNFLLDNSVYTVNNGTKYTIGNTDGLNMMTFSTSLGMGMEYNFTNNISLNLEPTFRYYLNPFSNLTGTNIHPYSFGIFSGLSYKF